MRYYPVLMRVSGRRCLVIGGGRVAEQKVASLLRYDAEVHVVSPRVTDNIAQWAAAGRLSLYRRGYESSDLDGATLAIAATNDSRLHEQVACEAAASGILLNVVDVPALCTFTVPAVHEQGDLLIAVSTNGTSPTLARRIRDELAEMYGPEYETALLILGRLRQRLITSGWSSDDRKRVFGALVDSPLLDHLRQGDLTSVDRILADKVAPDVSLAQLGVMS